MSLVYLSKIRDKDYKKLSEVAKKLMDKILADNSITLEKKVPIKVHFGEKGNTTFIKSSAYDGIIDYIEEHGSETAFIETNVLYRGSRTTREKHLLLAKKHGFERIPVIIADGELGEEYSEIKINKEYFESCKIGKEYEKYNQIIVTSHFKGHMMAGFGGAIKQLAMGFASRGGKLAQHSVLTPQIKASRCTMCGLCLQKCDVDAITLEPTAKIDSEKCIGCAGCIAVCPCGAIYNDWGAENFREKVSEYAYGASVEKEFIYINFLINITKECDCMGEHMDCIAEDIGILASLDPVSLDSACLDLLQKETGKKLFEKGRESLLHAEKIGLGEIDYEIEEL